MERLIRRTTAQQVAERLEIGILAGEFEPGGRLPPERRLAAQLGVCRLTLREGIQQLVGKGLLIAVPGLGTFISAIEVIQSIDTLAGSYQAAQIDERRVELVRHYLELRRFAAASVLTLVCERTSDIQLAWVIDAFNEMSRSAACFRNLRDAAERELLGVHIGAQLSDARSFWLVLNSARHFFRVAKDDVVAGVRLQDLEERSALLMDLLRARDKDAIQRYFHGPVREADEKTVATLKARYFQKARERYCKMNPSLALPMPPAPKEDEAQEDADDAPAAAPVKPETEPAQRCFSTDRTETPCFPEPDPPPLDRNDPKSWYPGFIDWYRRNFGWGPWDNPDEEPPGPEEYNYLKPG